MISQRNKIETDFSHKPIVLSDAFYDIIYKRFKGNEKAIKEYLYPSISHLTYYQSKQINDIVCFLNGVSGNENLVIEIDGSTDSIMACAIIMSAFRKFGLNANWGTKPNNSPNTKHLCLGLIIQDKVIDSGNYYMISTNNKYSLSYICFSVIWLMFGQDNAMRYRDLAAIGTISSNVNMTGESRSISVIGIKAGMRPGVQAFCSTFGCNKLHTSFIRNFIAPIFSFSPSNAVNLLLCQRIEDAANIVSEIMNKYELHKNHVSELIKGIKYQRSNTGYGVACFLEPNMDSNTLAEVSLKAKRIVKNTAYDDCLTKLDIPVYFSLFTSDKERDSQKYHGFCPARNFQDLLLNINRSIYTMIRYKEFVLIEVLDKDMPMFLEQWYSLPAVTETPAVYDIEIKASDINELFYNELFIMEPTGKGNPRASFLIKDACMKNVVAVGEKCEHFSGILYDETSSVNMISFYNEYPDDLDGLDCVLSFGMNEFNGIPKVQAVVNHFEESKDSVIRKLASQVTFYETRVKDIPISVLKIADGKISQLKKAGIFTIQDLVSYYPKKYMDYRQTKNVNTAYDNEVCSIIGKVVFTKEGPKMSYAICLDEKENKFMACWFNQSYVIRTLVKDRVYIFCGQVKKDLSQSNNLLQIFPTHYSHDVRKYKTIVPIYKKISGMSDEYLENCIAEGLKILKNTDFLEKEIVDEFNLLSDYDATLKLHHPHDDIEIRDAQKRKVFNRLFQFNFILKSQQKNGVKSLYPLPKNRMWSDLIKSLPYCLTSDQMNCLKGIYKDVQSDVPLNALVQGDVGCGKTMIALFSILLAVENGYQACMVAPTEVLAEQHFKEVSSYLQPFGINVGYLVGGQKTKGKKATIESINNGTIAVVVGTHAVLQDSVKFKSLALLVIDEQHRFGVEQREKLQNITPAPHVITMSATPIPRTLSMALYGDDIKVYNIIEKPAGRQEVKTIIETDNFKIRDMMLNEIRAGHQCYVICPLINKSDKDKMSGVMSVEQTKEEMESLFASYPEVRISAITGKMKKNEISSEINRFSSLETNVLISTTIIEVGVNIPNATMIIIRSSERFGLAQAHQLRGRVGRGDAQSYCVLQPGKDDIKANVLCLSSDGFEIAKQDLKMRGAGDYIGIQQSGSNEDVMLMISEPALYKKISAVNDEIYRDKARYSKYEYLLKNP